MEMPQILTLVLNKDIKMTCVISSCASLSLDLPTVTVKGKWRLRGTHSALSAALSAASLLRNADLVAHCPGTQAE